MIVAAGCGVEAMTCRSACPSCSAAVVVAFAFASASVAPEPSGVEAAAAAVAVGLDRRDAAGHASPPYPLDSSAAAAAATSCQVAGMAVVAYHPSSSGSAVGAKSAPSSAEEASDGIRPRHREAAR